MAEDRYRLQENILKQPNIEPYRHYESEGTIEDFARPEPSAPSQPDKKLIRLLNDLQNIYNILSLLPPDIGRILKEINKVLLDDVQAHLLHKIENEVNNKYGDNTSEHETEPSTDKPLVDLPNKSISTDIFSSPSAIKIIVDEGDSLLSLAQSTYDIDYVDTLSDYISKLESVVHSFFQITTQLANDSNMPSYLHLLKTFDGTAVKIKNPDLQHLKDEIIRSQLQRDQLTRFFNKTHTAAKTLIHTRSWYLAQKKREKYLTENYSSDLSTFADGKSHALLLKARTEIDDKYTASMYNLYKYLNSAAESLGTLLEMEMNEASAKAKLAKSGVDIFKITPPPPPTLMKVDDNKKVTDDETKKLNGAIEQENTAATAASSSGTIGGFGANATSASQEADQMYAQLGNKYFGNNGCTAAVKAILPYSNFVQSQGLYCPNWVANAKAQGIYSSNGEPGDVVCISWDGNPDCDHVVVLTTGGMYYGNSSSQGHILWKGNMSDWSGKIIGYIQTSKGY